MSETAVVMGGSLAGLMAARVLTERFEHVIVLERDGCLHSSTPHPGVPQAHHVHVLLLRGLQILDSLFPGFPDELIREGGLLLDSARDFRWFTPAGWAPRFTSGLPFLAVSRPLLESTVRRRVAQLSAVSMREGASATGLSIDKSLRRITGVCVEPAAPFPMDSSRPAS
jgi:2-polyprenyl-6-methoxyphenol hydroxylase-like FAD-dependent oxidoreductase